MSLLAISSVTAQGLACDNLVNVSLDTDCEAEITPALILERANINDVDYEIEIILSDGTVVDEGDDASGWPIVDGTHVGETLKVNVGYLDPNIRTSCWGNIFVEAKHGRLFENCENGIIVDDNGDEVVLELSCGQLDSLDRVIFPPLTDACPSLAVDSSFVDEYSNMPCPSDGFVDILHRYWIVTAVNGYESRCRQTVAIVAPTFENISWPPHYDVDTLLSLAERPDSANHKLILSCDFSVDSTGMIINVGDLILNADGTPSPESTGFPSDIACRNVQYNYKDITIPLCGNGVKILREWNILNWCTADVVRNHQVIKMVDDRGPVVSCPPDDIIVDTDPWACLGTIDRVPDPINIFDCSATSYTIAYKLRDESGNPFINAITDNVIDNGDGTFGISDLPLDTTWLVYTIMDECGFSTQCFTEIVVEDQDLPNAICEQNTVISLDIFGNAEVPADRFDDHSFDNCGIVKFQARKKDDTAYQDTVKFDCSDMTIEGVRVAMRAYDAGGRYGECWVVAKIQNKVVDVLVSCPPDVTIDCEQGIDPTDTGRPTLDESCISAQSSYDDTINLICGQGKILRTWTITDVLDNVQTCIQTISVTDTDPFTEFDIKWPSSLEIEGCSLLMSLVDQSLSIKNV